MCCVLPNQATNTGKLKLPVWVYIFRALKVYMPKNSSLKGFQPTTQNASLLSFIKKIHVKRLL